MRNWKLLVGAAVLGSSLVACTSNDDALTPEQETAALERASCEALTPEPTELGECGDISPNEEYAE